MADREWTLAAIEAALAGLPRPELRARLRADLEKTAAMIERSAAMTTALDTAAARQTAAPLLRVSSAARAIDFYTRAFGARELMRFDVGGQIPHAELTIGNAVILLADEAPEHGFPGPEQLGGSPVGIRLDAPDPDAAVERALAAGATIVRPVADQFYGERSGIVLDPFGYRWTLTKVTELLAVDEMHRRMAAMDAGAGAAASDRPSVREGFRTVTPYLVVRDAPALVEFTKAVFGATESFRATGSAGGAHFEVQIGDSMLMIGGGAPDLPWRGEPRPAALHVYVDDSDATYGKAVTAGATSVMAPSEMEYGERSASVIDPFGNRWYIATARGDRFVPEGLHTVNLYLHLFRAEPVLAFLQRAFSATGVEKYASPDGVIHHARVCVGDAVVEMGEAHGPYQPMPTMSYLYVPDADAAYRRALQAGATSVHEPADQPYGERTAAVTDAFGNQWYLATPKR